MIAEHHHTRWHAAWMVGEFFVALVLGTFLGGLTGGLVGVISYGNGYDFGFAFEGGATFGVPTGFLFVCIAFPLLKVVGKWKLWRVALVVTLATWAGAAVPALQGAPPFAWYGGAFGAFLAFVALMFPWRDATPPGSYPTK